MSGESQDGLVTYQIYWRSFSDSNGDGIGDIAGLVDRLDHVADLGVDAIWLNPMYPSPGADHGYDVSDYFDIDPDFGTLTEFRNLIQSCHSRNIKILMDVVPNHVSSSHPWFISALGEGIGNDYEKLFIIRDGKGELGSEPPNDWQSIFGGPAWSYFPTGEGQVQRWYLHMFDSEQPDLNWYEDEVREHFEDVIRFWFDMDVDGFRIDVAHGLFKAPGFPDMSTFEDDVSGCWDQPEVHEIYRRWRKIADSYDPPRLLIGEVYASSRERLLQYLGDDQLHSAFDFSFLKQDWSASVFSENISKNVDLCKKAGVPPTWAYSNHDEIRHWSRYASIPGIADKTLGELRYKSLFSLICALPGNIYLYNGEELGLPEAEIPDSDRQDPAFFRQPPESDYKGRDGCRVPMPWSHKSTNAGFTTGVPWLPIPSDWVDYAADLQKIDERSILSYYGKALALRKENNWMNIGCIDDIFAEGDVLCLTKKFDGTIYKVLMNFGNSQKYPIEGGHVIFRSSEEEINHNHLMPGELAYLFYNNN